MNRNRESRRCDRVVSMENTEPFFSEIQDVCYHGIKDVYRVTLHNGKYIDVTKDHSLYASGSVTDEIIPTSFTD
jgi:intein/homing endonuclease